MYLSELICNLVETMADIGDMEVIFTADESGVFKGIKAGPVPIVKEDGQKSFTLELGLNNPKEERIDISSEVDLESGDITSAIRGVRIENGKVEQVGLDDLPDDIKEGLKGALKDIFGHLGDDEDE